jgi:RNA polymerase sigma-70 factor (ECF subfamily)
MTEAEVAQLYSEYGYFLFRRCFAYLGDAAAADDAVQEVFVRALRGAAEYRGEAAPRTWLCRIADHLCVDLLRRRQRNPVQGSLPEPEVDTALEPSARADDRDALVAARRLLAQLEPESQRLALLYYVDELTQEELAEELGVSRRTIGKRLQALMARARALLGTEEAS